MSKKKATSNDPSLKKSLIQKYANILNTETKKKRQAALNILKPSGTVLEHGLSLHRESVVCDTYSFAPTSPINGQALCDAVKSGCTTTEFVDLKEEMGMIGHLTREDWRQCYISIFKEAGVTCIFQNAGECQSVQRLVKRLARFTYVVDMMPDLFKRAVLSDHILDAHREGKSCLYFSGNAVPLAERWESVEEELSFIRVFFQLGMRMMHLTYNRRNMIGNGCGEAADAGLSDFGKVVIGEMNRVGIIVDVAHCGQKTSMEAAHVSSKPVVASHSGVFEISNHYRCKTDEVIRAIADSGGYVGICCINKFLGRGQDINALLDHVDYIAKKFGCDYVSIGTDTGVAMPGYAEELKKIEDVRPDKKNWRSLWPPVKTEPVSETASASLSWTNWPLFTVGLVQRGYSDSDIQKIIGGNMLRVIKDVEE